MRQYELVVVFSPILSNEDKTSAWDRIKRLISSGDGEITQEEDWGMRRLAYPIRKGSQTFLEGSYFLTRFSTDTVAPRELEPQLNLEENILRYLLVNADSVSITAPTTADFTPREPGPRRFDSRRGPGGPFRGPPPPGGPPPAPMAARVGAPAAAPVEQPANPESPAAAPAAAPVEQPATAEAPAAPAEASGETSDSQVQASTAAVEEAPETPDAAPAAPAEASVETPDSQVQDSSAAAVEEAPESAEPGDKDNAEE